jgi:hypothetical protein
LIKTASSGVVTSQAATIVVSQTTPNGMVNCRFTHFPR